MHRIGMAYQPTEDFNHPAHAPDDLLSPHVLYRINRPE